MRGTAVAIGLVGALLVGAVGGEAARTNQLRAEASRQVRTMLPAVAVSPVSVRGFPLLLTAADGVVSQADTALTTRDGHRGYLVLSEFDVASGHARSASLVVRLAALGDDVRPPSGSAAGEPATVERDGRLWHVAAWIDGDTVRVGAEEPESGLTTVAAVVPEGFRGATPRVRRVSDRETFVELRVERLGGA
ncbi:hypothetical protein LX15_001724 [Streptoalloteichus tenebrarius]|uniref:Uncharacterized protein n=1 Tax=Streptoalloteichus tenebrarius (strain ATCC 17920 / DSM 40477 / JCM 4838 / CBS 697.72 / NBRC 16177 / NCIMB 11028 / NRRL B-12390 / A12253. 1 / ISP 5477) TaxID=1933 RepID=A0ABT1HRC9_STRSD|nr:hypothetical protein [Streptoalloteichus tenebrarius]MCP2258037.1 hypothetical protein [Streptoalloteichus tenebrarius]BFF01707.1 hypothetical protein GCM10020241_33820 [Streptoalloteichus tenebrarius]